MNAPDPARQRFQLMAVLRLYGLALVALGMVLWRTAWLGVTQPHLGRIVIVVGMIVLTLLPALLRRHWRRPQ